MSGEIKKLMETAGTDLLRWRWASVLGFIIMMAGNAAQALIFSVPPPLLPAIARYFNASSQGVLIAQLVLGVAALGMMFGASLSGMLIARMGLRTTLLYSCLGIAVFGCIPVWTHSADVLLGSRLLTGFCTSLLLTAATVLVALSFQGAARQRVIGYQVSFAGAIFIGIILLSGRLVQHIGWRLPFLIYFVFGALVSVIVLISALPDMPHREDNVEHRTRSLLSLWPIYGVIVPVGIFVVITATQLPFLLLLHGVASPSTQAIIIGAPTFFSAITGLIYGRLATAVGPRRTLAVAFALGGVGMFILSVSHNVTSALAGASLIGVSMGVLVPYFVALTIQNVAEADVGHAVGGTIAAMFLGSFLNPFFMSAFKSFFGLGGALDAVGVICVVAAAFCLVVQQGMLLGTSIVAQYET